MAEGQAALTERVRTRTLLEIAAEEGIIGCCGSPGRTRTCNISVNSRTLYH
jgi:hypothetical protein